MAHGCGKGKIDLGNTMAHGQGKITTTKSRGDRTCGGLAV